MRRLLFAAAIFFAAVTNLCAQSGQLPAWNVSANPSASPAPARSAAITTMLDGAFCNTQGSFLQRGASTWGCFTSTTLAGYGITNARTLLLAATNYWVNGNSGSTAACGSTGAQTCSAGNDSNDCLTPSTACLTAQHVVTLFQNKIDLAFFNPTINLAHNTGTTNYAFTCSEPFVGGFINVVGDTTSPGSVVVTAPNGSFGFFFNAGCQGVVNSVAFSDQGSAAGAIHAREGAIIDLQNIVYNAFSAGGVDVVAEVNSIINFTGACTINGGAGAFAQATNYSKIDFGAQACNVTTPVTYAFTAQAVNSALLQVKVFTGSAVTTTIARAILVNGGAYLTTSPSLTSCNTAVPGSLPCQITGGAQTDGGDPQTTPLAVPSGGTGLASGTSGGILYFNASNSLASSGALTNHAIVLGGGAGGSPTVVASLGTTTTVLHGNASGAPTFGAVNLTSDVTGTLPPGGGGTGIASGTSNIVGPATSVNFGVSGDNAISTPLPSGYTQICGVQFLISGASGNLTTATFGVNTATGGGGSAIIAAGTAPTVTTGAANTNNNLQIAAASATTAFTPVSGGVQFRVGTTVAQSANVQARYIPCP